MRKSRGRRLTWLPLLFLPLLLASVSLVGALEVTVSPNDPNWKTLVQTSAAGTTIRFLPGVYQNCNVAVPAGVTLAADSSTLEAKVTIDCANDARCVYSCVVLDCVGVVLVHFWKYHSVFERRHVCDKALDFPAAASARKF